MKKIISAALAVILLLSLGTTALATKGTKTVQTDYCGIKIVVDGREVVPQTEDGTAVEPFAINGTTYLPVRAIAGALGLGVAWDGAANTIVLTSGYAPNFGSGAALATNVSVKVAVTYQNIKLKLDGTVITPKDAAGKTVEPFVIDGTTYLPVRAVANALGADVAWDSATNTVTMTSTKKLLPTKKTVVSTDKDGNETENYVVEYTYDKNGNLLTEISTGTFKYSITAQYDDKGNVTEQEYKTDTVTMSDDFTYNDAGKLISTNSVIESESVGTETSSRTLSYDDKGLVVKELYTSESSNGLMSNYEYRYFNDENGRATGYIRSGTIDNLDVLDISTSTYDKRGSLTSEFIRSMSDDYSFDNVYTYDDKGNQLSYTYSYLEGTRRSTGKTVSTFDKYGNELTSATTQTIGGETTSYSFANTYDSSGRITRKTCLRNGDATASGSYVSVYKYAVPGSNYTCTTTFGDGDVTVETFEFIAFKK